MPTKFTGGIDLANGEIWNACFQNLAAAPGAKPGKFYFNTTSGVMEYNNGSTWVAVADSIAKATFDANTILKADVDDTPIALTVGLDTIVGRVTGANGDVISGLTATQTRSFLGSLDLFTPPAADLDLNGKKLTNVGDPVNASDAATMAYVDSARAGLSVKDPVRVASTSNVNRPSPGATIDGTTLANGDRVLLKDQTTASQNGIYEFAGATSPMVRTDDADTSEKMVPGSAVWVNEGANNADKRFVLTTNAPIALDVTNLVWTMDQSGSTSVTGTVDRITVTGSQIDIAATYTGQTTITTLGTVTVGVWNGTPIDIAHGGTGATDAATARANLGVPSKLAFNIGDGSATSFTVTHNLNSKDVFIEMYEGATGQTVYADVTRTSLNALSVAGFVDPPGVNQYTVVVIG